jgi:nucleotide-binding universal stress UspA family protein
MNLSDPILVAIDFKAGFELTIEEARRVAAVTGAALILAHAVPVQTMPEFGDDTTGDCERAGARCRALLSELTAEKVRVSPDPVVSVEELRGLIMRTARAQPLSFVFLGDGGKAELDRVLAGVNTEKILRESLAPVWVVCPRKRPGIERLLVAVDTSRAASEALKLSASLAKVLGARLDVLRVFAETQTRSASLAAQQAHLRRYASQFDLGGVDVEFVSWEGEPGKRIVEAARVRQADLLVLGSAGRRGIHRWLQRPMSEQVVRQLPCSLLSVPAVPGERPPNTRSALG